MTMKSKNKDIYSAGAGGQINIEQVKCEECKCLLNKEDAHVVEYIATDVLTGTRKSETKSYCNKCKPSYDEVKYPIFGSNAHFFKNERIEVNEQGEQLEIVKLKERLDKAYKTMELYTEHCYKHTAVLKLKDKLLKYYFAWCMVLLVLSAISLMFGFII